MTSASSGAPALSAPAVPPAALLLAATLAATVPTLLAYNQPPSATLLNQCLAVALWGGVVMVLPPRGMPRGAGMLLAAIALMVGAALGSWAWGALPRSLALQAAGLLLAAGLMVVTGASAAQRDSTPSHAAWRGARPDTSAPLGFDALAFGLLLAGVLASSVALMQVFAPGWADANWIAPSAVPGRAVGNLRQPNHLASLLLWGLVAGVALQERGRLHRAVLGLLAALMVLAIELSASRTGAVGLGLLLLWGVIDKRLSPASRWLLAATPLLYGAAFGAMAWYGDISHQALGAAARVATEGAATAMADSPNSRANIWRNAVAMIAANPWTGVGFGEFNFAWSLSAFAHRPTAFFDHTHNLALQLAVELGLPGAALVLGLMLWALAQAASRAWKASTPPSAPGQSATPTRPAGLAARASVVLVLITLLHSSVEYPLWYAYFLLPTALAWGWALGSHPAGPARSTELGAGLGAAAGLLMALLGALAVLDYQRVVVIYAPTARSGSLASRIEQGQRSPLFAHHADYAAATNEAAPASTALGFARATHSLLDTRLMVAWARRLLATGQDDPARWLAQRLQEFNHPEADALLAPCRNGATTAVVCQAPHRVHDWREFLTPVDALVTSPSLHIEAAPAPAAPAQMSPAQTAPAHIAPAPPSRQAGSGPPPASQ